MKNSNTLDHTLSEIRKKNDKKIYYTIIICYQVMGKTKVLPLPHASDHQHLCQFHGCERSFSGRTLANGARAATDRIKRK